MKKIKIISIFIILLSLFSLCSLTVNAEETPDASKLVVIVDEDYRYYDLGGMSSPTWTEYLNNYYNPTHEDSPFAILGDYVIYENSYLTCRGSLVSATATVTNSTGVGYYLGDPVYTVTVDTITFSTNIPETMLFSELIAVLNDTDTDNLLTCGGYYGTYYVYYNSRLLYVNDSSIEISNNVGSGVVFSLSEVCSHDWYVETVIQANTCISDGSGEFRCRRCDATEVQTMAADSEYGHLWKLISCAESTCIGPGIEIYTCEYCSKTFENILTALGHKFTEATCTEDSKCIRCNVVNSVALGHDLNWRGQCSRCDYKEDVFGNWWNNEAAPGLSNFGQNIVNGWNEKVAPGFQNIGQAISNGFNYGVEKVKEAGTNVWEFLFPGEDGKGLGANTGITGNGYDDDNVSPSLKEILNVAKWVIFIIPIIFLGYLVIKYSIKIKREVDKNKTDKKGK